MNNERMIAWFVGGIIGYFLVTRLLKAYILSSRIRKHIRQELNEVITNPKFMVKGKND